MADLDVKALRQLGLDHLLELRARERLTASDVRRAALEAHTSSRTVYRWLERGELPANHRPRYEASERDQQAFFEARGRYHLAYALRRRENPELPSQSSWTRALKRALSPGERAFAREGEVGRRRYSIYLRWEAPYRNAVWEADHSMLDVLVLAPRSAAPQRPWLTVFQDAYTRAVMGWALSMHADTLNIQAALHAAVASDGRRGPFAGVPEQVRYDNGRDWLSRDFTDLLRTLGTLGVAVAPYAPNEKGKVERFFGTLDREFCALQPHFTGAPRSASGQPYGPSCDPIPLARLATELSDWMDAYNTQRPHSALGGQPPLAAWHAHPRHDRTVTAGALHRLLPSQTRRVLKDGVHFDGETFTCPQIIGIVGEDVEVRYRPHDLSQIYVFRDGEFLATAKPASELSPDERAQFLTERKQWRKRSSSLQRKASKKLRQRIEPHTGPSAGGRMLGPAAPSQEPPARGPARPLPRVDLLGLDED